MFDAYYKFSFVRNPWSRVVSLYKYFRQLNRHNLGFKQFVLSGLDKLVANGDYHVRLQVSFV